MDTGTHQDLLAAGTEALATADWVQAREHFAAAAAAEGSAEAYDGLGWAAWWLADAELTIGSREAAFRAFRARGEDGSAARVAAWLAADHREFHGEVTVGQGWLGRAAHLVENLPEGPDHGWLALLEADFALNVDADPARAERRARYAADLGRRLGIADFEAVGSAQEGIAMVISGRVEEGMRRLDQATTIARAEELELPISLAWSMCCLISACDGVGDFRRAAEWCGSMRDFTDQWGARQLVGICRSAYGRVLATSGDWGAAEVELVAALADLEAARPGMSSGGMVRLAELRARQGRSQDARELYERAGAAGLAGRGALDLEAGDAAAAADACERLLRGLPDSVVLERLPALEVLARARAALGEEEAARAAQVELEQVADTLGTPYLCGRARMASAEVEAARGDGEAARRAYEDAVDLLVQGAAPYDAALARLGLARVLASLGRDAQAGEEARAAREAFSAFGAERDVGAAEAVLAGNGDRGDADGGRPAAADLGELTAREVEILRLVAAGLSDAAIAERLVLSPHTVHRHVANIRAKLRLPSRSAAVAYAARSGLL